MNAIDPKVELLADIPIVTAGEDLFDHQRLALRLAELAMAAPITAPRVIGLTGSRGTGKSSVLQMLSELIEPRNEVESIALDAQAYGSAQGLMIELAKELDRLFSELGVARESDKVRDTLVTYGGIVSNVIRLAGVKVDVSGALERSAASLRGEIARNLEQAGKRLVVVVDHLDLLPVEELRGIFAALRMYAAIPYIAVVIAVDRHAVTARLAMPGNDPTAFERLVHTELVVPPASREVLARVMTSGIKHIASRIARDLDPALALFDAITGIGLALIDTPRDAKRAINALSAALPLQPSDANPFFSALELLLRIALPELDAARLDARHRTPASAREPLFAELVASITQPNRLSAGREALRVLVVGD